MNIVFFFIFLYNSNRIRKLLPLHQDPIFVNSKKISLKNRQIEENRSAFNYNQEIKQVCSVKWRS